MADLTMARAHLIKRALPVWRRNFRVWQKLMIASLLGNFLEPLLYLFALGYGLGRFVTNMDGIPYVSFLASGIVCSSAMMTASFECLYSAYTRRSVQGVWDAMLTAPLAVDDVILGEMLWAGTKSVINVTAILIVAGSLGIVHAPTAILAMPIVFLVGICFAAMALVITAFAYGYEFFLYYMSLFLTPLLLLSGVFFPFDTLPDFLQKIVGLFPLAHAVKIVRPLVIGGEVHHLVWHLSVIVAYLLGAYFVAVWAMKRRLYT